MSDRKDSKPGRRNGKAPRRAVSLVYSVLIGMAMSLAWGLLSDALRLESLFPAESVRQMFARSMAVQIALYGFLAPAAEEIVFRKLLFDLAVRYLPEWAAAVAVSALFAIWHGNVLQMLYAFPAGLILQAVRSEGGRMEDPVVCHISANLTAIAVTWLQR